LGEKEVARPEIYSANRILDVLGSIKNPREFAIRRELMSTRLRRLQNGFVPDLMRADILMPLQMTIFPFFLALSHVCKTRKPYMPPETMMFWLGLT